MKRTTGLTPEVRSAIEQGLAGVINAQGGTAGGAFADYAGRDAGDRQDRHRGTSSEAGHVVVRRDHQPRQPDPPRRST